VPTVHYHLDYHDCSSRNHDILTFNQVKNKKLQLTRLTSPVRLPVWLAFRCNLVHSYSYDYLTSVNRPGFQKLDNICAQQITNRSNFSLMWLLHLQNDSHASMLQLRLA